MRRLAKRMSAAKYCATFIRKRYRRCICKVRYGAKFIQYDRNKCCECNFHNNRNNRNNQD